MVVRFGLRCGHSRLREGAAAPLALLLLLTFSTSSSATTWLVTPHGGAGYDETGHLKSASTHALYGISPSPGDVVQLLSDSGEADAVTDYGPYISLKWKGSADSPPITVRGLAERTAFVGRSLEQLGRCPAPETEDEVHCNYFLGVFSSLTEDGSSATEDDLLEAALEGAPSLVAEGTAVGGSPGLFGLSPFGVKGLLGRAACIDLDGVDGLIIENLTFENCWLSSVRAVKSRRITLRNLLIKGGSFGLAISGIKFGAADHITVEDVTWIQDTSGFAAISKEGPQKCTDQTATSLGCAGEMWRRIPWGSSHHGTYEQYNGALLGGYDISGPIIFRRNKVFSAYNGIRLKAKGCSEMVHDLQPALCRFNSQVWIYDNIFSYIRDNPIELEVFAKDAKIFHNTIHNAHAWFSFDGMGGGPVYVYGNRGWFDDMPVKDWHKAQPDNGECKWSGSAQPDSAPYDPAFDRHFDYKEEFWLAVGMADLEREDGQPGPEWMNPDEQKCERGLTGRVIKLALPPKYVKKGTLFHYASEPIYVFNNSWFLRAPVTSTDAAANVSHWNNAIAFCEEGVPGYDPALCNADTDQVDIRTCADEYVRSDGFGRYPGESGAIPLFDCFRWLPFDEDGEELANLDSHFDYDVSSNGFPAELKKMPDFEAHGRHGDPGFRSPATGDFTLLTTAAAARSACLVKLGADGKLACLPVDPATSYAGAFSPAGTLYSGPAGTQFQPPD